MVYPHRKQMAWEYFLDQEVVRQTHQGLNQGHP